MTSNKRQAPRLPLGWNPNMPAIQSEFLPPEARQVLIEAARQAKYYGEEYPPKRAALIDEAILHVTTKYPEFFQDKYRRGVLTYFSIKHRKV